MAEKSSRIRFGLIALFALIVALGVLMSLWNPFPPPSRSNFGQIEVGMIEAEVAELVGAPDQVLKVANARLAHVYQLNEGEGCFVLYADGRVVELMPFSFD